MKNKKTAFKGKRLFYAVVGAFLLISILIWNLTEWFVRTFGVSLDAVYYTLMARKEGAETTVFSVAVDILATLFPALIGMVLALLLMRFMEAKIFPRLRIRLTGTVCHRQVQVDIIWLYRVLLFLVCMVSVIALPKYVDASLDVSSFIKGKRESTQLYEERYIDPKQAAISAAGKPKNLIYIYLESMETTYASTAVGGGQPENNYIPNLTRMAGENISFSDGELLGGWHPATGTGWTVGALFATNSGVPFAFPGGEDIGTGVNSASNITTLGDVLAEKGYHQEFLCGSDAGYGGRDMLFSLHGDCEIFDYNTAIERGYIDKNYYVWWGFEDEILYRIARDEVSRLAAEEEPFSLMFLTVDTHFPGGYVCDLCEDEYPESAANVVACADRQIDAFVRWCREQDFYEDTLIVVTGDHPRMDTHLIQGVDEADRRVYNCFINAGLEPLSGVKNRAFTAMDMFPTVLSALGFQIEGERLGLGVNLFSNQPTLAEEMGYEAFNAEISKRSDYYIEHFS